MTMQCEFLETLCTSQGELQVRQKHYFLGAQVKLRLSISHSRPITLTVAKCWDPNPRSCFALPRSEFQPVSLPTLSLHWKDYLNNITLQFDRAGEPIRPIDPAAWVSHTAAMTGVYPPYGMSPSMSTVTSTSSSISSSIPETEREWPPHPSPVPHVMWHIFALFVLWSTAGWSISVNLTVNSKLLTQDIKPTGFRFRQVLANKHLFFLVESSDSPER